jgi:LDH2 family malate/lactate/ureidoglycolate dehydrogenase
VYEERIETLIAAMTTEPEVRLPGERREASARKAAADGIEISSQLHEQLITLAG